MNEYKIENHVPAPELKKGPEPKYPFGKMAVGESVFLMDFSDADKAYDAAKKYGQRNGMKFSRRKSEGGVRIWRVA